jgi:hypothetical protein
MRKLLVAAALLATGLFMALDAAPTTQDEKPKVSISDVMTKAHPRNTGLRAKLLTGKASKEEKQELLDLYIELGKNKPPKGDVASWKKRTENIVKVTKDYIDNKPGAKAKFDNATKCADCHNQHRAE